MGYIKIYRPVYRQLSQNARTPPASCFACNGGADPLVRAGPPGPALTAMNQVLEPPHQADGGVGRGPGGPPHHQRRLCRIGKLTNPDFSPVFGGVDVAQALLPAGDPLGRALMPTLDRKSVVQGKSGD